MTQCDRILSLLLDGGTQGVSNVRLNQVCFRYSARIADLKRKGYNIVSVKQDGSLWFFVLLGGPGIPVFSNPVLEAAITATSKKKTETLDNNTMEGVGVEV